MTRGQELAIEQLRRIEAASAGKLDVHNVRPPTEESSYAVVDVGIDCTDKTRLPGGTALRSREWLVLCIPRDFPFKKPSVCVRHKRFADLPHVQWVRHLCLYRGASEWNPGDGMYGFFDRLDYWLTQAARGELDPVGEPMHPPVTYVPTGLEHLIIPRKNAPTIKDYAWIGFAALNLRSETRAEIDGWFTPAEIQEGVAVAAAILLSDPMPFEFPSNGGALLTLLKQRGVPVALILSVVRVAVLLNSDQTPLFVIIGTPMRGIAGAKEKKQHLAAWYIHPEIVRALRLTLHKYDAHPRLRELGEEVEAVIIDWLDRARVAWCRVQEERPEVTTRRDAHAPLSWFNGKAVTIWGCGALGSHLANFLARAGVKTLVLCDKGIVTPGILTRQQYTDEDISIAKVDALAAHLKQISRQPVEIVTHADDLLEHPLGEPDWTDASDVVIDTTASSEVALKLELRRHITERRATVVGMSIGHTADMGLLLIAGKGYSGGLLNVERQTRLKALSDNRLRAYADEFWPKEPRTRIFEPEPGCSDATFIGSAADVAALAASMLNLTAIDLQKDTLACAHFVAQPHVDATPHHEFACSADCLLWDPESEYEVRLAPGAIAQIQATIEKTKPRLFRKTPETGGLLFGERDDLLKILWIDGASGPPPDSKQSPEGFLCGVSGTQDLCEKKREESRGLLGFAGMWHTHPTCPPVPSVIDIEGMRRIVCSGSTRSGQSLLLIIQPIALGRLKLGAYVFSRDTFSATAPVVRLCAVGEYPPRPTGLASVSSPTTRGDQP